jgi:hypothetical protein
MYNDFQKKVATVLKQTTLCWASIDRFVDLIEGRPDEEFFSRSGEGWIMGECHYGSRVDVSAERVEVRTCGNHWVVAVVAKDAPFGIGWETDTKPSATSWGDCDPEADKWPSSEELEGLRLDALFRASERALG